MKNLKYEFTCAVCKKKEKSSQIYQKLCSEECRIVFYGKKGKLNIATASVGSVAEMAVCIEMLKRGYSVFRTVSQASFCDVVAIKNKETMFIEVRTSYRNLLGGISFPKILHNKIANPTHYGLYLADTNEIVLKEISDKEREKFNKF